MNMHDDEAADKRAEIRLAAEYDAATAERLDKVLADQAGMVDAALAHAAKTQGQAMLGIPLQSLPWLTDTLCGLRQAMVLAGPPNCGKSVLTTQMLLDAAADPDTVAVSISTEMDPVYDTLVRTLSGRAGVEYRRFLLGSPHAERCQQTGLQQSWEVLQRVQTEADALRAMQKSGRLTLCHVRDLGDLAPFTPDGHALDRVEALVAKAIDRAGARRAMVLIDYMQLLNVRPRVTTAADRFEWRDDLERDRYIVECISRMHNAMPYNALVVISEQAKGRSGVEGDIFAQLGTGRTAYAAGLAVNLWHPDAEKGSLMHAEIGESWVWADDDAELMAAVREGNRRGRAVVVVEVVKSRNGARRKRIPLVFNHELHRVTEATSRQRCLDLLTERSTLDDDVDLSALTGLQA
jgi:replicative DNA helicase